MNALILIDMQNDFMSWGADPIPGSDSLIKKINHLMPYFQHTFACGDLHPQDHISFALNHGKRPGEVEEILEEKRMLYPEHCIEGTIGSDLAAGLDQTSIQKVFFKGKYPNIDDESAFFDQNKKNPTGLQKALKKQRIKDLYFAGVPTETSVRNSVLDALELGFHVHLIVDVCCGRNKNQAEKALKEVEEKGVFLTTFSEIQKRLKKHVSRRKSV